MTQPPFKAPPLPPQFTGPREELSSTPQREEKHIEQTSSSPTDPSVTSAPVQGKEASSQESAQAGTVKMAPASFTGKYDNNFAADFNLPPSVLTSKSIGIMLLVTCVIGLFLGSVFFGGGSEQTRTVGLQGVVANPDITTNIPRCGRVDKGQACILYIVNHTRYDKIVEDFFDEAVRLTEVAKYSISMVNPKYAKTRIPPGYFAQIKIPDVR